MQKLGYATVWQNTSRSLDDGRECRQLYGRGVGTGLDTCQ